MLYNDHDRSRSQVPAEPLVLVNNTDPRRARLIRTNHLNGLFVLTCCSSGGRGSSASAGFTPHESLFVRRPS
jgi:hypothetical protein